MESIQTVDMKKQIKRFITVGCTAVVTDFIAYTLLQTVLDYLPAKALSFIAGTVVAYILNKHWTFEKKEKSHKEMFQFITLYTVTLGANVLVNQTSLYLFPQHILLGFLFATGTSAILNFIGQKWWVFK